MIWLSISLFSNKRNWHKLITNGIVTFLESNSVIKGSRIEFSYLYGENIRLALLTEESNAIGLANAVSEYFVDYFIETNISKTNSENHQRGLFMLFPPNSIQFGLFPPEIIHRCEDEHYSFSVNISKAMLFAFNEAIDDETILTFAFYLHIILIKAIYLQGISLDKIFSFLGNAYRIDDSELVPAQHEMYEITYEVMENSELNQEFEWLNEWSLNCAKTLDYLGTKLNGEPEKLYFLFVNSLNTQLGISEQGNKSLLFWVESSLKKYSQLTEVRRR